MEGKEEYIIEGASKIFNTKGIKTLTMDEIAKELKVSKKTIYVFFRNREMLLNATVKDFIQNDEKYINGILKKNLSAIDEFCEMAVHKLEVVKDLNPSYFLELAQSFPKAMLLIHDHIWKFMLDSILKNIIKGQLEGIFRKDIDAELIARLHLSKSTELINSAVFPANKYSFSAVLQTYLEYHLRGISTEKGLVLLNKKEEMIKRTVEAI
jgi:AcrR family transcriptional regulator